MRTGIANLPLHGHHCPRWLFDRMVKLSRKDPVRYSFAHGGKDGHPFPVNRQNYDRSINLLENALRRAKTGDRENIKAL